MRHFLLGGSHSYLDEIALHSFLVSLSLNSESPSNCEVPGSVLEEIRASFQHRSNPTPDEDISRAISAILNLGFSLEPVASDQAAFETYGVEKALQTKIAELLPTEMAIEKPFHRLITLVSNAGYCFKQQ